MGGSTAPGPTVSIAWADCRTPFGNAGETLEALLAERVALVRSPVLTQGEGEIDEVPLALFVPLEETTPPRGWSVIEEFVRSLPEGPWGSSSHPVIFASSNFGIGSLLQFYRDQDRTRTPYATPHDSVDRIREIAGWGPDCMIISHACVSAQLALHEGARRVAQGAEQVLVFAYDLLSDFVTGGFHALKILNGHFPAPFMAREEGSIALGDGIAATVLTAAKGSGWKIAEQRTWNEMFHMTANEPEGVGFDALLQPSAQSIGDRRVWIKGHGTGTLEAARLEAEAVSRAFGSAPLLSWKGSLGHTLGSCAVVELAIALEAMAGGRIPGTVHGAGPCPPIRDSIATASFAAADFDGFMLLSNAFGGAHAGALVYHD